MRKLKIIGTGSYVPPKVLTNFDLEKMVDTSDEWIRGRTGVKERHIVEGNTATSDLAVEAAKDALSDAGLKAQDLDVIIIATATPDTAYPSTACWTQKGLGIKDIPVFDIGAACSGFLYGFEVAASLIATGKYNNILVSGAEVMSKVVDWEDRNTCVLFGDGAGACIVAATDGDSGILASYLGADGTIGHLLVQPAGGTRMPASHETVDKKLHTVHMQGREVFKYAVRTMGGSVAKVLKEANLTAEDIALYVPHQANLRIVEATCRRVNMPMSKTSVIIDKYGNVPASSIPLALDAANKKGKIKSGDLVLFSAFGAGFTWGAMIFKW
ncbi:ketoacyl-ACP synthase III [candidate division WOR-3 bacterium]|nr:ketoacyl-ACP synthase III [candidate division WOR-3 bacterium]